MTRVRQPDRELRVVVSKQDKILGDLREKGDDIYTERWRNLVFEGGEAMICQRDVSGGGGHQLRMMEGRGRETEQGPLVASHQ